MKLWISFLFLSVMTSQAFAISQSTALPELYCRSLHLSSAEQTAVQYESWSKLRHFPKNEAENSSAQIFDTVGAYAREFQPQAMAMDEVSKWQGRKLYLNEKIPQKWRGLWTLHATLEKALTEAKIDARTAFEIGIVAQQALAESQGLAWGKYREELNQALGQNVIPLAKDLDLHRSFQTILNSLRVDKTYQIPYLAGYAKQDSHKIYIDRGVKGSYITRQGRRIDVSKDLSIHEFIEKVLIDWTQLSEKVYLRSHQIAQRVEKAMVLFYDYSWEEYQGNIMHHEIDRADSDGRSDLTLTRVPYDLDLTPYIDFQEWEMIQRMKKAAQP